jgi:glyoxylase-like metal-dependent hydrolase (beta-lactamase superfamily II)
VPIAVLPDFVSMRSFGQAKVAIVCEGTVFASLADLVGVAPAEVVAAVPEADAEGQLRLAFTVTHIRLGDASVLVDGGIGEPSPRPNLNANLTPGLDAGLGAIGVRADDITHVVFTHAHWDHVDGALVERGGQRLPRFPRARYIVGRADLDVGRAGTHPHNLCTPELEILLEAGVLDQVDGDYQVAPGIRLVDAPGETPAHHCVLVESEGASFMQLGDLYHHSAELAHGWVQVGSDRQGVHRSRERVLSEALGKGTTVAASHSPFPGWSRVERRPDGTFRIQPLAG